MASTRLTDSMRDVFVEQVMVGIPIHHPFNIDDVEEKIAKLVEAKLPAEIKKFAKEYPNLIVRSKRIPLPDAFQHSRHWTISVKVVDHESCEMVDCSGFELQQRNHEIEQENRNEIESQVRSVAYACTTVEKLKLALPELESYMPKPNDRQLPIATPTDVVVANLMTAGLKLPKDDDHV